MESPPIRLSIYFAYNPLYISGTDKDSIIYTIYITIFMCL